MRAVVFFLGILFSSSILQANDSTTGIVLESRDTGMNIPGSIGRNHFHLRVLEGITINTGLT